MILLSVFGGGLFMIPVLLIIGILIFGYQTIKASRSNSTTQVGTGSANVKVEDNTGNIPFYKVPQFIFVVIFVVALIVTVIMMVSDK